MVAPNKPPPTCPRCRRPLEAAGEISVAGFDGLVTVWQCGRCTHTVELYGAKLPAALTFIVDAAGRLVEATDLA